MLELCKTMIKIEKLPQRSYENIMKMNVNCLN